MMCRALTDHGHAMSHLSTLVPKLAATAAAAGDPYPLIVLEASRLTQSQQVRATHVVNNPSSPTVVRSGCGTASDSVLKRARR